MGRQGGPVVVCVINLKGGVGKSTITAMLARAALIERSLDVLAIDLDPQANLSQGLMHNEYNKFLSAQRPSIVEIFNGYAPPSTVKAAPSALQTPLFETIVSRQERSLELVPSRFDFSDNLLGALKLEPRALARFLARHYQHKDLILIDCSPTESIITTAAYHASGKVLVPVKPEYFATVGFPLLNESLQNFRRHNLGHHIEVTGVVINNAFYDGGNNGGPEKARAMRSIKEEAAKNSWNLYANEIEHSRGFPKLMRGDRSYQGNAQYFSVFANEFFRSVGL